MNKEKEMYMIIESLSDRIESFTASEVCSEERKEYHISMMRLEASRLLELLGTEEVEADSDGILGTARENFKKVEQLIAKHGLIKTLQLLQPSNKRRK
jgi:hypothetical protein